MANRTPLFSRAQPGGVFTISDVVNHPGNIWWVDSATGVDGAGYGQNPDAPCATWNYAYDLATASQGDVIYLMPGHNEAIINATTIVLDTAGITTIGLGRGRNRPIIDFDNTASKIIVSGANQRISNVIFNASVASCVLAIDVNASDFELDNCYFTWESTGDEFISMVDVSTVDRVYLHDNVFETEEAAGAATEAIRMVAAGDLRIEKNIFRGTWTGSVIFGITTLSPRLMVLDNVIYNSDTSNYNCIDPGALATTGIVANNVITGLYTTAVAKLVRVASLMWLRNTVSNNVGERGALLVPATSSA